MITAVDLFAGAGGASTGLQLAAERLRVSLKLTAINHWPAAVQTHAANHPDAQHLCMAVEAVDPRTVVPGGRLNLLVAGPECFPAGTLILTSDGLIPIEDIVVGQQVLTHEGRWRRVTSTMQADKPTVIVRGHGHPGIETTAEHPFWTRSRRMHWPRSARTGEWRWSAPEWTKAIDVLTHGEMLAKVTAVLREQPQDSGYRLVSLETLGRLRAVLVDPANGDVDDLTRELDQVMGGGH